jgi:hypothetical protein
LSDEEMIMNTKRGVAGIRWWMVAVTMAFHLAGLTQNVQAQRDPGVNQPGAAGNRGGRDPGVNQPGAAGNVGRDPGVN